MWLRGVGGVFHTDLLSTRHVETFVNHFALVGFVLLLGHSLLRVVLGLLVRHS